MYYTSDGNLDPKWVDSEAVEQAQKLQGMKTSQLRKFYADVKSLERQYMAATDKDAAFARILPMIKLLKAKSAYALTRKVVPKEFRDWLWKHVDNISTFKDFSAFLLNFEAVVGFSSTTKD